MGGLPLLVSSSLLAAALASASGGYCCWWPQKPTSDICSKCVSKDHNIGQGVCHGSGTWCSDGPPPPPPPPPSPPPPPPNCSIPHQFPKPTVTADRLPQTQEQQWMEHNWPGYHNGVNLGGAFVIEDWMFKSHPSVQSLSFLQLDDNTKFTSLDWSEALLKEQGVEGAYATMDCHVNNFYNDAELDMLADFGINAIRLVAGYWLFDDPELYPHDTWAHKPSGSGKFGDYGVNPDGFVTPGTRALSDMVMKLWNRNMKVVLDMHALPGCSSPDQSYAGVFCEARAPNTWNGKAHDGISGGHQVQRADDGKTWTDVTWKIHLRHPVPTEEIVV